MSGRDPSDALAMIPLVGGSGMRIGELMALGDDGATAFVQPDGAVDGPLLRARTLVDLHADHIGAQVLLTTVPGAAGGPEQHVLLGVLRDGRRVADRSVGQVDVEVDGERFVVQARRQLVLRCGKASITLTQAGKILLDGTYVVSRSSGANRIKGASVQLN